MNKNNDGILAQIRNGEFEENKTEYDKQLDEIYEKLMAQPQHHKPRSIWLMENAIKQFHEEMGDEGFYSMVTGDHVSITTNTGGMEYINQFIYNYEKERETMWVCPACGRSVNDPENFSDTSCVLNSLLVYKDKVKYGKKDVLVTFVEEGGVVDPQPEKFPNVN